MYLGFTKLKLSFSKQTQEYLLHTLNSDLIHLLDLMVEMIIFMFIYQVYQELNHLKLKHKLHTYCAVSYPLLIHKETFQLVITQDVIYKILEGNGDGSHIIFMVDCHKEITSSNLFRVTLLTQHSIYQLLQQGQ